LLWRQVDVVIVAGAEKKARVPVDGGVMVAAQVEAILQSDALGSLAGEGDGREGG
jgi:hypothetical protein